MNSNSQAPRHSKNWADFGLCPCRYGLGSAHREIHGISSEELIIWKTLPPLPTLNDFGEIPHRNILKKIVLLRSLLMNHRRRPQSMAGLLPFEFMSFVFWDAPPGDRAEKQFRSIHPHIVRWEWIPLGLSAHLGNSEFFLELPNKRSTVLRQVFRYIWETTCQTLWILAELPRNSYTIFPSSLNLRRSFRHNGLHFVENQQSFPKSLWPHSRIQQFPLRYSEEESPGTLVKLFQ